MSLPLRSKNPPIGLHLDGEAVTLVQMAADGSVAIAAAGELPHGLAGDEREQAAAEVLGRLVADHHFAGKAVVSTLSPAEYVVQNVRLPQVPEEELPQMLAWEAAERLPFPAVDAEIRHLLAGTVRHEGTVRQEVILLGVRRDAVLRHVALLQAAGLTPTALDLPCCGLLRGLAADRPQTSEGGGDAAADGEPPRRAYLHLGTAAVTVIVAAGGRVMFLKHLQAGGQVLDGLLARAVGLNDSEAAAMRRRVIRTAALDPDDDLHRTVVDALRTTLEGLATEVELCLRHVKVTFRGTAPTGVTVTGPDACEWMAEFFADRLRLPACVGHPFGSGAAWPDDPGRFTVAAGLSLRGSAARAMPA